MAAKTMKNLIVTRGKEIPVIDANKMFCRTLTLHITVIRCVVTGCTSKYLIHYLTGKWKGNHQDSIGLAFDVMVYPCVN